MADGLPDGRTGQKQYVSPKFGEDIITYIQYINLKSDKNFKKVYIKKKTQITSLTLQKKKKMIDGHIGEPVIEHLMISCKQKNFACLTFLSLIC